MEQEIQPNCHNKQEWLPMHTSGAKYSPNKKMITSISLLMNHIVLTKFTGIKTELINKYVIK